MSFDAFPQGQEPERYDPTYNRYDGSSSLYNSASGTHKNPRRITKEQLDELTLDDYGLTVGVVKGEMFGLEVVDPQTGESLPDAFYESKIEKAISLAEQKFDIAIFPRLLTEHHDYHSSDASSYMYTHSFKRPIIQVEDLSIEGSSNKLTNFPRKWYNVYALSGHVEMTATPLSQAKNGGRVYNAIPLSPFGGSPYSYGKSFAPQMLHLSYVAGLLPRENKGYNLEWEMPAILEEYITKSVAKQIFQVYGRTVVPLGTQNYSLSIDGISESVNSNQTSTNTAASAEIKQLDGDLSELETTIRGYFGEGFVTV